VFHPLEQEHIREIAIIQPRHLRKRLKSHGSGLMVSYETLDLLAESDFDLVYVAGPMINDSVVPLPAAETWCLASPTFPAPISLD
jgi:ATP-dependent Clp protease ATP-binding subunit ClpA